MSKKTSSEITIKEKILDNLLEGPKTQTELLIKLGYGKNQHKNISKDLKMLNTRGFIEYKKIKSEIIDDDCTFWSITSSYEHLKCMLKEYPSLLILMQKNNVILEIIYENTFVYVPNIVRSSGILYDEGHLIRLPEGKKEGFKEKLRLSPEFFRYNLLDENNVKSEKGFEDLTETLNLIDAVKGLQNNWGQLSGNLMDTAFKVCVLMDILKGQSSIEAKNYLIGMEMKKC